MPKDIRTPRMRLRIFANLDEALMKRIAEDLSTPDFKIRLENYTEDSKSVIVSLRVEPLDDDIMKEAIRRVKEKLRETYLETKDHGDDGLYIPQFDRFIFFESKGNQ